MSKGKYTQWINPGGFTDDNLHCLLWMIGEFGIRSHRILKILEDNLPQKDQRSQFDMRALNALVAISRMVTLGERFNLDDWCGYRLWHGYLVFDSLPESFKTKVSGAAPQTNWDSVIQENERILLYGTDENGRRVTSIVTKKGEITIKSRIPKDDIPKHIEATLMKVTPDSKLVDADACGATVDTVDFYECRVSSLYGRTDIITIGSDGEVIYRR
jgi:hypothetical protein